MRPGAASRFIAVSQRVSQDLARHHGLGDDVSVIHHGVDTMTFDPKNRGEWRRLVRDELGFDETDCVMLYVGDWQKAGVPLITALASVAKVKLAVVSGSSPDLIRRDAASANVADRLVLVPPTSVIERYYPAADAFLFPSFYDTFGMVVAEAMAHGAPVIARRLGPYPELLAGGGGMLFGDPT